ncbi:MAG: transporter substrate-binding protein [Ramlibacter sp.]|jgi:tripartite-type tricarboxylate transporter receptor subunit TctC|uniref:Bug family tripartite tricarboxylate transporter substrate binding protein n=1 Tax=Ramlibacter sp. TaxID=1917967 RepID=UPI00260B8072|nr:tripartite tricarboxylate transporter substrate-binding protein [Ramlibacter sp.]MDB5753501.1 transporter substrate-binding protein [Ramlibacter sp.]
MKKRTVNSLLLALGAMALPVVSWSQAFPNKPLKLIVPFPAGGPADAAARVLAEGMSAQLGQPVIIENRGGASTMIATSTVQRAPADGYTIGMVENAFAINHVLTSTPQGEAILGTAKLPYETFKDFSLIAQWGTLPLVIIGRPNLPAADFKAVLAQAKSQPGQLSLGTLGPGNPFSIGLAWLSQLSGAQIVDIPYKGLAPATQDLMGGQIDLLITVLRSAKPLVDTGKAKMYATLSAQRSPELPNIPTVAEHGFPGYDVSSWFGIIGPAGLSKDVETRLTEAIRKTVAEPSINERLAVAGTEATYKPPEQFRAHLQSEVTKYKGIISKLKPK